MGAGVNKIRLTGGEPTLRKDLVPLVQRLHQLPGRPQIGITSNGIVLKRSLQDLQAAGMPSANSRLGIWDSCPQRPWCQPPLLCCALYQDREHEDSLASISIDARMQLRGPMECWWPQWLSCCRSRWQVCSQPEGVGTVHRLRSRSYSRLLTPGRWVTHLGARQAGPQA